MSGRRDSAAQLPCRGLPVEVGGDWADRDVRERPGATRGGRGAGTGRGSLPRVISRRSSDATGCPVSRSSKRSWQRSAAAAGTSTRAAALRLAGFLTRTATDSSNPPPRVPSRIPSGIRHDSRTRTQTEKGLESTTCSTPASCPMPSSTTRARVGSRARTRRCGPGSRGRSPPSRR